jgi:GxxExxY protein
MQDRDPLPKKIIGAAIEVHRTLGPGLLESAHEECLCRKLENSGLSFQRQVMLPIVYKEHTVEPGFRADVIVERQVLIELKAVATLLPVHTHLSQAQWDRKRSAHELQRNAPEERHQAIRRLKTPRRIYSAA